jgi:predicted transglutaminase-like cysteine proteinase
MKIAKLAFVLFLAGCQTDDPVGARSTVTLGGATPTPRGYYEICKLGSVVCEQSGQGRGGVRGGTLVQLTAVRRSELDQVNASVNRSIRPETDAHVFGVRDAWKAGGPEGDCEDFAITKKQELMRRGWPSQALLLAIVRTRSAEEHAVLVVRTTSGDLVLDNLRDETRLWGRTEYRGEKIQSPNDNWAWLRLN